MSERRAGSLNEEVAALRRDVTEKLAALPQAVAERVVEAVEMAEQRRGTTFLGWSRARWQGLLVGMVLTLVLVGPPSALEAEVALYRRLWGVTTEAERARIRERLQSGRPSR